MNDERQRRLAIRELIENWVVWRDAGDWDRFAGVWHDDGRMMATWWQGPATEFIRVSREGFARGVRILHFLGGTSIDLAGDRAIAQTKMTISQRAEVDGVRCDVVCTGRFYDFFERRSGRWGLVLRQPIYEKDRLDPIDPAARLTLDARSPRTLPGRAIAISPICRRASGTRSSATCRARPGPRSRRCMRAGVAGSKADRFSPMALAGKAFLALWNDIARAREPEYDRWHTKEHVPERVAVQGFHGARRYVNRAREHHRYFTLYDVADLAVFDHAEYTDLVQHPTPWSASMRPDFANFLRATCSVELSTGDGLGAALAILCYERAQASATGETAAILALPGVVACHVGQGSGGSSPIPSTQPPASTAPTRAFDRVMLIEALDRDAAAVALRVVRERLGLSALPFDFGNDVYDLAFAFPGHDAGERRFHRRPHWDASSR